MGSERLIDLVQLLQAHSKRTFEQLARDLSVSVRTVHRDVASLSLAGVPVVTTRGAQGGVGLAEGYRLRLRGLTSDELAALAGLGIPRALEDLGLQTPLRTGFSKLMAALSSPDRPVLEHARQRLHMDSGPWFGEREHVPHLSALRDAVWRDLRIRVRYRDFDGTETRSLLDPYGLVIKAERWYVVAGAPRGTRVYRCARITSLELLRRTFKRPRGFELSAYWAAYCARFARERPQYLVDLELDAQAEAALRRQRPASDAERLDRAPLSAANAKRVTIDFERETIAIDTLARLAPGARVLAPVSLRAALLQLGRALCDSYESP